MGVLLCFDINFPELWAHLDLCVLLLHRLCLLRESTGAGGNVRARADGLHSPEGRADIALVWQGRGLRQMWCYFHQPWQARGCVPLTGAGRGLSDRWGGHSIAAVYSVNHLAQGHACAHARPTHKLSRACGIQTQMRLALKSMRLAITPALPRLFQGHTPHTRAPLLPSTRSP